MATARLEVVVQFTADGNEASIVVDLSSVPLLFNGVPLYGGLGGNNLSLADVLSVFPGSGTTSSFSLHRSTLTVNFSSPPSHGLVTLSVVLALNA